MRQPRDIAVAIRERISGVCPSHVDAVTATNHRTPGGLPMPCVVTIPVHLVERARRMRRARATLKGTAKVLGVDPLALAIALGERIRNDMSPSHSHSNTEKVLV